MLAHEKTPRLKQGSTRKMADVITLNWELKLGQGSASEMATGLTQEMDGAEVWAGAGRRDRNGIGAGEGTVVGTGVSKKDGNGVGAGESAEVGAGIGNEDGDGAGTGVGAEVFAGVGKEDGGCYNTELGERGWDRCRQARWIRYCLRTRHRLGTGGVAFRIRR